MHIMVIIYGILFSHYILSVFLYGQLKFLSHPISNKAVSCLSQSFKISVKLK